MSLNTRLGLRVELEFTEGVWTDIAADYVLARPITIRRGRDDWAGQAAPASLSIEVDNKSGAFTPGNRDSPHWPNVRRGIPIRVIITHDAIDYTRFVGEVASWKVSWPAGNVADPATAFDGVCHVEIEAGGVLRNMRRGPSKSPPVWTAGTDLFDASSSKITVDPVYRYGQATRLRETAPTPPRWTSNSSADPLSFLVHVEPNWNMDEEEHLTVGTWTIDGDGGQYWVDIHHAPDGSIFLSFYEPGGGEVGSVDATPYLGRWTLVTLNLGMFSSSLDVQTIETTDTIAGGVGNSYSTLTLAFTPTYNNFLPNSTVSWYLTDPPDWVDLLHAAEGWPLESPEDRTTRILAEAGFTAPIIEGESGVLMGPQQTGNVVDVLRECGDVGGMLVEDAETQSLRLRTWGSLYNQAAVELDAAAREIDVPLEVVLDDQGWVTEVTASNHAGESVTVADEDLPEVIDAHVPESITANVAGLAQMAAQASWRLHLGTVDEPRSPSLTIDLGKKPELIPTVTDLVEGDVVRIVNLPDQWPAGNLELMLQGAAERIESLDWVIVWNATPGSVWTTGTLAPSTYLTLDGSATSHVTAPDSAALDITGDLDIRACVAMDDWSPTTADFGSAAIVGKWGADGAYALTVSGGGGGVLSLRWVDSSNVEQGPSVSGPHGFAANSIHWVRATLDVDDGGNHLISYYVSDDPPSQPADEVDWVLLGTDVHAGTTDIRATTDEAFIGGIDSGSDLAHEWPGEVFYAEIRNGIDGAIVASPDFRTTTAGAPDVTDDQGNVWTLDTGAEIVNVDYDARLDTAGCELVSGIDDTATSFDVDTTVEPVWVNSTDHPDEFPLLIEIGGERMSVGAVTVATGTVQTFSSISRSVNGVVKPHSAGAPLLVAEPLIVTI